MTTSSPTARFCPSNQFTKMTRTSALCRCWLRFQIWVLSAQPLQKITRTHQDKHTTDEISVCWIVVSFPSKLREQQTHADFWAFHHLENHPNSKFDVFLTEKSRYSKNLQQIFNGFWVSTPSFFQGRLGRGISAAITKMASDMRRLHKILKSCQEKDSSFNHIQLFIQQIYQTTAVIILTDQDIGKSQTAKLLAFLPRQYCSHVAAQRQS